MSDEQTDMSFKYQTELNRSNYLEQRVSDLKIENEKLKEEKSRMTPFPLKSFQAEILMQSKIKELESDNTTLKGQLCELNVMRKLYAKNMKALELWQNKYTKLKSKWDQRNNEQD